MAIEHLYLATDAYGTNILYDTQPIIDSDTGCFLGEGIVINPDWISDTLQDELRPETFVRVVLEIDLKHKRS